MLVVFVMNIIVFPIIGFSFLYVLKAVKACKAMMNEEEITIDLNKFYK